jgi:hypothetical protein
MAKYLQRYYFPRCNDYLGIVIPDRKAKMQQWTLLEMWLSAGVGLQFSFNAT